jgi:hypothetical protein
MDGKLNKMRSRLVDQRMNEYYQLTILMISSLTTAGCSMDLAYAPQFRAGQLTQILDPSQHHNQKVLVNFTMMN